MTENRDAPFRLSLLGQWDLRGPDGRRVRSVLSQPKRLCLLAYLSLADRPISRATVVSIFWPESDEERARNALSQSLHYLRRSLTKRAVVSVEGDRLAVSREVVAFDAREFLEETRDGDADLETARRVAEGADFFEGWNADDTQPLQEWLDTVRRRIRAHAEELVAGSEQSDPRHDSPGHLPAADGGGNAAAENGAGRQEPHVGLARPALPSAPGRPRRGIAPSLGVVALVVAIALGIASRSAWRTDAAEVTPPTGAEARRGPEVAVLMPQVTADDSALALSADAVHSELLARLNEIEGPQIYSMPFARSVSELRVSLNAVGGGGALDPVLGGDGPDLVLAVSIRVAAGEARVVATLLGGPPHTEILSTSARSYRLGTSADALLSLPQEIAEDVAAEITPELDPRG